VRCSAAIGKDQTDRRTVGIGYDKAAPAHTLLLSLKRIQMMWIDFGNQERDIGFHAVR
jgi:hypothetical protein